MDEVLIRRHGYAPPPIRQPGLGQTIVWEPFTTAETGTLPGWERLGQPNLSIRNDPLQGKYLLLAGSPRDERRGVFKRISDGDVAGRVIRMQVKVLQPASGRNEVTRIARMRLEWQDSDGKPGSSERTLSAYTSPGWENCEKCVSVPAGARDIRLAMIHEGTADIGFDDVLIERMDPLVESRSAGTFALRSNLIDGGDFEVGQRNFSVWGERRTFDGGVLRAFPIAWSIDETIAAVGTRSLRIPLDQDGFRLAFGWVRVQPNKEYVASLYVRSNTKTVIRVGVVEYPAAFFREDFQVDDQFRKVAVVWTVRQNAPWAALSLVIRSSPEPKDAFAKGPRNFLWIDGVSLTAGEPKTRYEAPSPVEVGILGPDSDSSDISNLIPIGKPADLTVRAMNYQTSVYDGQLAVDVVDAYDRPVVPHLSYPLRVEPGKTGEKKVGALSLPRGYYKLLATVWPGRAGEGQALSTFERAFAVINPTDAVPTGNYFGMTVENPRISRRVTQLGAGWVWLKASPQWCLTPAGELDWTWYQELLRRAREQRLEILADLGWDEPATPAASPPAPGDAWKKTCGRFAQASAGRDLVGLGALGRPNRNGVPASRYVDLMGQAAGQFRLAGEKAVVTASAWLPLEPDRFRWLNEAVKAGLGKAAEALAFRFQPTEFPEDLEPALEEVRNWRKSWPFKQYFDVGVGGRGPSAYLHVPNLYGYYATEADQGPEVPDPILHASRLVRALAIRQFAMIDRAAWWVESHPPPDILRPSVEPLCHEYDNGPRPSVVAFDYMAEMLNAATLVEWIDLPQQARALCFERSGGDMVVLLWRPFGWTLRPVALRGAAGSVAVTDLFGRREEHPAQGGDLLVQVNESVRYVMIPASKKEQILESLRKPMSTSTAPARAGEPRP